MNSLLLSLLLPRLFQGLGAGQVQSSAQATSGSVSNNAFAGLIGQSQTDLTSLLLGSLFGGVSQSPSTSINQIAASPTTVAANATTTVQQPPAFDFDATLQKALLGLSEADIRDLSAHYTKGGGLSTDLYRTSMKKFYGLNAASGKTAMTKDTDSNNGIIAKALNLTTDGLVGKTANSQTTKVFFDKLTGGAGAESKLGKIEYDEVLGTLKKLKELGYVDGDIYTLDKVTGAGSKSKLKTWGTYNANGLAWQVSPTYAAMMSNLKRDIIDPLLASKGASSSSSASASAGASSSSASVSSLSSLSSGDDAQLKRAANLLNEIFSMANHSNSPLVIDMNGDGITTVDKQVNIKRDGKTVKINQLAKDDLLIVNDKDGNGKITDWSELFGNTDTAANGYKALEAFDKNKDGKVDDADKIDGKSALDVLKLGQVGGTLKSLRESGIKSINTGYQDTLEMIGPGGDTIQQRSTATKADGKELATADVWFKV